MEWVSRPGPNQVDADRAFVKICDSIKNIYGYHVPSWCPTNMLCILTTNITFIISINPKPPSHSESVNTGLDVVCIGPFFKWSNFKQIVRLYIHIIPFDSTGFVIYQPPRGRGHHRHRLVTVLKRLLYPVHCWERTSFSPSAICFAVGIQIVAVYIQKLFFIHFHKREKNKIGDYNMHSQVQCAEKSMYSS
jgi:hypothetical protein